MAKRKMKISFTRNEAVAIYCLFQALSFGTENLRKAVGINKLTEDVYDDILGRFSILVEDTFPPEVDPIYEMTGGYLSDGVCITPDGRLYSN